MFTLLSLAGEYDASYSPDCCLMLLAKSDSYDNLNRKKYLVYIFLHYLRYTNLFAKNQHFIINNSYRKNKLHIYSNGYLVFSFICE